MPLMNEQKLLKKKNVKNESANKKEKRYICANYRKWQKETRQEKTVSRLHVLS